MLQAEIISEESNFYINDRKGSKDRAWISINSENLFINIKELQKIMSPPCKLMAVVKANAYGHGSAMTAALLNKAEIFHFAVATLQEGIELRLQGIKGEILILGYTSSSLAKELCEFQLTQTVIDFVHGRELIETALPLKIHIKIDTGMHRLGFAPEDIENIIHVFNARNLKVMGLYTHLCVADSLEKEDIAFTENQIDRFYKLVKKLKSRRIQVPIHIQSTYGLLNYNRLICDYARIGIGMYGTLSSAKDKTILQPAIKPVLSLHSRVALTRKVEDGETIGYGRTYVSKGERMVAVITIGYGDGYPRNLSEGRGKVIIRGVKVPIVGRICMDQLVVDISGVDGIHSGDVVTLIGTEEKETILAAEVADEARTITNELLCRLGNRLSRIYI